jgi:hypothetical protein
MLIRTRIGLPTTLALAAACCCLSGAAAPAAPATPATPATQTLPAPASPPAAEHCANPQSPRRLEHFDQRPTFAVTRAADSTDSVRYTRRSDRKVFLLKRCGQHYHCSIENVQPECGQEWRSGECGEPAPGSWVEVHTVFSTAPSADCADPEGLGCCKSQQEGDPVLVLGYHAKVTAKGPPLNPIPVPWGFASAQWSGSTTGTKAPEPCKPAAQWDFVLGCGFTVSKAQLGLFTRFDQARPLQQQLSRDLTRTPAP